MAWIFVDKESEGSSGMRSQMRRSMRGGYRYGGSSAMMRGDWDNGYREGYKHGWEDHEDETEEGYRRMRDSRGRFI